MASDLRMFDMLLFVALVLCIISLLLKTWSYHAVAEEAIVLLDACKSQHAINFSWTNALP